MIKIRKDRKIGNVKKKREEKKEENEKEEGIIEVLKMRIRGKNKERREVKRIMIKCLRCEILIGEMLIDKRIGNGKRIWRDEVRIVVSKLGNMNEWGRMIIEEGKKRMDIIR